MPLSRCCFEDSLTRLQQQQRRQEEKPKPTRGRGRGGCGGGRGRPSMKRPAAAVKPNASCQSDEEDRGSEHGSNTGTVRYEEPEPAAAAEATKQKRATKSKQGKAKPSRDKRKNEEEEEEPAVAGKRKKKDAKPCEPPASAGETATENPATSKTFARRYCPKGGPNKEKWIGLRDAYHAAVSNQIDHFFKFFTAWYPKESLTNATADRYKCLALLIVPEYLQQEALKDLVKDNEADE
eukprot:s3559_g4.t1